MSFKFPTIESLRKQAETFTLAYAVWPGETIPNKQISDFLLPEECEDVLSPRGLEPLLIDANTAARIVKVYDTVTGDHLREKIERMVSNSRSNFMKIAEVAWR